MQATAAPWAIRGYTDNRRTDELIPRILASPSAVVRLKFDLVETVSTTVRSLLLGGGAAAATKSSRTSANTVRMPSPTSAWAIARPMPLPAPVTRAASRAGSNKGFRRLVSVGLSKSSSGACLKRSRRHGPSFSANDFTRKRHPNCPRSLHVLRLLNACRLRLCLLQRQSRGLPAVGAIRIPRNILIT